MDTGFIVVLAIAVIIVVVVASRRHAKKQRRERLLAKCGDADLVDHIIAGSIWQGMTKEQLIDSWGTPAAIDDKVYKTKTAQTFKHGQTGRNRYSSRVKLENDSVVGWEQK